MDESALSEDEREQRFWRIVLRVVWTAATLLMALGLVASLAALLAWRRELLLCLLGLVAGAALAVALLGSIRSRELTSMVLGGVTLPFLAAYLTVLAVTDEPAFDAYGARFLPFLVSAVVALLAALVIAGVWRGRSEPVLPPDAARPPEKGALP
jgi:hypothetical protein